MRTRYDMLHCTGPKAQAFRLRVALVLVIATHQAHAFRRARPVLHRPRPTSVVSLSDQTSGMVVPHYCCSVLYVHCAASRSTDQIIDATTHGSRARYINHSCDPNCYAIIDDHQPPTLRIFVCAGRRIRVGEEITYDYEFAEEDKKLPCFCGAASCSGTLN